MSYIDGFVAAVPQQNRQAYIDHVQEVLHLFKEHGATRMVDNWADDVPPGKLTDFYRAVAAQDAEAVVFSWLEWPSRQARDAGMRALMEDKRMQALVMPFDGKRLIFGGFTPIVDTGAAAGTGYVDGFVVPVRDADRQAYLQMASGAAQVFAGHGATRVVEAWGDDLPAGKLTDFRRAVAAKDGESVVFSFIEWPSKQVRDAAWPKVMADPGMQPGKEGLPFDGQRMIHGGFATILDA